MALAALGRRALVAFPAGANASDSFIAGEHFNLSALTRWHYQLFDNNTLSNNSWCVVTFAPYTPKGILANGSFVNATWCFEPMKPTDTRGIVGISLAVLFGAALVMHLVNLPRHGALYLPVSRRYAPVGRRWQWYWGVIAAAAALVSLVSNVDVDRYYLPETPLLLMVFFWYLMQMAVIATVWEAVRHWSSWMERQMLDADPLALRDGDRRSKTEFYLPLVFYLFWWLHFFLIVPRNWGDMELQRSPEQTAAVAIPAAINGRIKAAPFLLFASWLVIAFSLRHSVHHYFPKNRGVYNRSVGFFRYVPLRLEIIVPLSFVVIAFEALTAFSFAYSPVRVYGANVPAILVGGFVPSLLILWTQALFGFITVNEDKQLTQQRRERGATSDAELGIARKPQWWRLQRQQDDTLFNPFSLSHRPFRSAVQQRQFELKQAQTHASDRHSGDSSASSTPAFTADTGPTSGVTSLAAWRDEHPARDERAQAAASPPFRDNSTTAASGQTRPAQASASEYTSSAQTRDANSPTSVPEQAQLGIRSMLDF